MCHSRGMDVRDTLITPLVKGWPILVAVVGGVWKTSQLETQIQDNTADVAIVTEKVEEHVEDAVDRLARIETKIDVILEKE